MNVVFVMLESGAFWMSRGDGVEGLGGTIVKVLAHAPYWRGENVAWEIEGLRSMRGFVRRTTRVKAFAFERLVVMVESGEDEERVRKAKQKYRGRIFGL